MMITRRSVLIFLLRFFAIVFIIVLPLTSAAIAGFLVIKTYSVSKVISTSRSDEKSEKTETGSKTAEILSQARQLMGQEKVKLKWGTEQRVNVLLLGKASSDYPGSQLTDTIILASLNPKTGQSAMLSIPRDLYVKIPEHSQYTKINSIYYYGTRDGGDKGGVKYINAVIEEVTGQKVDYFVVIDFHGFEKLIDEVGGLRVNVPEELTDKRYPGPNFSYQTFHIDKGWQDLDGVTALKYVRTRHNADGDFGRAARQQQVLQALKEKFFSLNGISFLAKLNSILDIISQNILTDIDMSEYGSFLALARDINVHNTINKVLDDRGADPVLVPYSSRLSLRRAYFLKPAAGDYSEIKEIAENIFDLEKLKVSRAKRANENPKILIVNKSGNASYGSQLTTRIRNMHFTNISVGSGSDTVEDQTIIYDHTGGLKPYSLDMLVKHMNAELQPGAYPGISNSQDYDIVIVAGKNISDTLKEDDVVLPDEAYGDEE